LKRRDSIGSRSGRERRTRRVGKGRRTSPPKGRWEPWRWSAAAVSWI
jgi:hypothetical protein